MGRLLGRSRSRPAVTPAPLDREPRSVRPPFLVRDDRFDHLRTTDPEGWRRAVHLDRVDALLHAVVAWLAGWDIPTVAPVVRLLWAARAAVPLTEPGEATR
jgi:hypothetical protein